MSITETTTSIHTHVKDTQSIILQMSQESDGLHFISRFEIFFSSPLRPHFFPTLVGDIHGLATWWFPFAAVPPHGPKSQNLTTHLVRLSLHACAPYAMHDPTALPMAYEAPDLERSAAIPHCSPSSPYRRALLTMPFRSSQGGHVHSCLLHATSDLVARTYTSSPINQRIKCVRNFRVLATLPILIPTWLESVCLSERAVHDLFFSRVCVYAIEPSMF